MSSPGKQTAREIKLNPLKEKEFLQKQKEGRWQFPLNKSARETSEQTESQRVGTVKLKSKSKKTPEELFKIAESNRKRRHRKAALETPEEKAVRLATRSKKEREFREKRNAQETPEQSAMRRALVSDKNKLQRQKQANMNAQETPEQYATRRAVFLEKRNMRERKRRAITRTAENEKRKMAERELCLKRAKQNTGDQIDGHSSCTFSSFGHSEGGNSVTTTERSGSVLTTTDEFSLAEHNHEEAFVVKNEASLDSWSCFDGSQPYSVGQEIVQDNRDFESSQGTNCFGFTSYEKTWTDKTKLAKAKTVLDHNLSFAQTPLDDDSLVYGKFIADQISQSNRNYSEINYAKALIESVMLNLSTGVYSYLIPDKTIGVVKKEKEESLPNYAIIPAIQQDIIVKEEVDL